MDTQQALDMVAPAAAAPAAAGQQPPAAAAATTARESMATIGHLHLLDAAAAGGDGGGFGGIERVPLCVEMWALETPVAASKGVAEAEAEENEAGLATPATERDSDVMSLANDDDDDMACLQECEEEGEEGPYLRRLARLSRRALSLDGTEATGSSSSSWEGSEDGDGEEAWEDDHDADRRLAQRLRLAKEQWAAEQDAAAVGPHVAPSCLPFSPWRRMLRSRRRPPAYVHTQLPLGRLEPYLREHGFGSMAYGHLHKAQRHFEVVFVCRGGGGWRSRGVLNLGSSEWKQAIDLMIDLPIPPVHPPIQHTHTYRCRAWVSCPTAGSAPSWAAPPS